MRGLSRRMDALERSEPAELSPAGKAWLGWPLTDAERAALNDNHAVDPVDTSKLSKEAREWLGV
jgi:hypothetical protein